MITEVGYLESLLESEDGKGAMHFHQFEIADDKKIQFVTAAKNSIKQGWYIHICKDGIMTVVFRDKIFEFTEDEKDAIEAARTYGTSIGIIKDQMPFENMINDPFY